MAYTGKFKEASSKTNDWKTFLDYLPEEDSKIKSIKISQGLDIELESLSLKIKNPRDILFGNSSSEVSIQESDFKNASLIGKGVNIQLKNNIFIEISF